MIRILLQLWEAYGLDALQIGIIVGLAWKFATNHWKHLTDDVKEIKETTIANGQKIQKNSERISKVEGKLE